MAFEVDEVDTDAQTGWNVTVVGQAQVHGDPTEVAELEAFGGRGWGPGEVSCFITVDPALVRGRRIVSGTSDDVVAAVGRRAME